MAIALEREYGSGGVRADAKFEVNVLKVREIENFRKLPTGSAWREEVFYETNCGRADWPRMDADERDAEAFLRNEVAAEQSGSWPGR
jgi:hypothetical protein